MADKDKEIIIIDVKNENKNQKAEEKEKENQICYICQEKSTDPITPAGCQHIFCRAHLKVN